MVEVGRAWALDATRLEEHAVHMQVSLCGVGRQVAISSFPAFERSPHGTTVETVFHGLNKLLFNYHYLSRRYRSMLLLSVRHMSPI